MPMSKTRRSAPTISLSRRRPARANRPVSAHEAETLSGFDLDTFLDAAAPSVQTALKDLDVERRARSDGRQNHPPYDAAGFGAFEDRIVDYASSGLKQVATQGVGALRRLRREIDDGLSTLQSPDFEAHERDVSLALDDRYSRIRYDLRDLFKQRMIAERNLNYFRRSLGVARPAQYPESAVFHFGLLLFVVVLESVANAYFFSQASDLGLLGGVLQAAVFSIVNVAWSFGLGLTAYRYLNAPEVGWKALALIGVVIHLAGALFINLAIAHYRDLIALSPDSATFAVVTQLLAAPLQLESFESLMLFLIGTLIAGFAVWKGYTTEDPLPGYGPADRAFSEVDAICRDTRAQLLVEAEDALEAARDPIDEELASFEAHVGEVKDRLEAFRMIADSLNEAGEAYQRISTSLLKTYREENMAVRNDPPPEHFEDYPQINAGLHPPSLDDVAERIRLLEDLIEDARIEASNSRTRLQTLHEENRAALDALFQQEEAAGGRIAEMSFPAAFEAEQRQRKLEIDKEDKALLEPPLKAQKRRAALERAAATAALMEDDESDGEVRSWQDRSARPRPPKSLSNRFSLGGAWRGRGRRGGRDDDGGPDVSPIDLGRKRRSTDRRRGGVA